MSSEYQSRLNIVCCNHESDCDLKFSATHHLWDKFIPQEVVFHPRIDSQSCAHPILSAVFNVLCNYLLLVLSQDIFISFSISSSRSTLSYFGLSDAPIDLLWVHGLTTCNSKRERWFTAVFSWDQASIYMRNI